MSRNTEIVKSTDERVNSEKEGHSWRNPGAFPAFSDDAYQAPPTSNKTERAASHDQLPKFEGFSIGELDYILEQGENLKWLGNQYLEQYHENARSGGRQLLMKNALDQFVVKKLKTDPSFARTEAFRNYANYIIELGRNKVFRPNANTAYYPELATNVAFKDQQTRQAILKRVYPSDKVRSVENAIRQENAHYFRALEATRRRLEAGQRLPQERMNFVGDYLYQSRDFEHPIARTYAEYVFNNLDQQPQIKPSTPMLGALANYFAFSYTEDSDVRKHSRMVIANYTRPGQKVKVGASLGGGEGCVLEQNHFLQMSLTSDKSMSLSRTNKYNDLYRFMMISFHELTHDHQKAAFARGEQNTSAMSYILNQVLRRGQRSCYSKTADDGSVLNTNYYKENHDCDEIEIQADEEAWRQCRSFLAKHQQKFDNNRIYQNYLRHSQQCSENEAAVRARRAFTRKIDSAGNQLPYIQFDIENLRHEVARNSQLIDEYPLLGEYIDKSGNLRPSVILDHRIGKSIADGSDTRNDDFGTEIGTFMLMKDHEVSQILQVINSQHLSKKQLDNLEYNCIELLHKNILKARDLDEVDFRQYQETRSRRDTTMDADELKSQYFEYFLRQGYNCCRIFEKLKEKYPDRSERLDTNFSNAEYWFGEFFRFAKLDTNFAKTAVNRYRRFGQNETMSKIARWIEQMQRQ